MLVITQDVDLTCCQSERRFWLGLFLPLGLSSRDASCQAELSLVQLGWVGLERTIERGLETRWHLPRVVEQLDVRVTDQSRVSRAQHCWYFRLDNSLFWGAVLWLAGCLEASLASTYQMWVAFLPPFVTTRNASTLYRASPGDTAVPSNELLG